MRGRVFVLVDVWYKELVVMIPIPWNAAEMT